MQRRAFLTTLALAPIAAQLRSSKRGTMQHTSAEVPSLIVSNIRALLMLHRPDLYAYFAGDTRSFLKANAGTVSAMTPVTGYTSYATFAHDIAMGQLVRGSWVLYDLESWDQSPDNEKHSPRGFLRQFSQVAHTLGLHTIVAPGIDLCDVAGSDVHALPGEPAWKAYMRTGIPAACDGADIFLCQSQQQQADRANFGTLLREASSQTPGTVMFGGLTTDRPEDTAGNYAAAYFSGIGSGANGFWHNSTAGTFPMLTDALDLIMKEGG